MYDYELLILIYELIRLNPKKIHYIRGNHEEKNINNLNKTINTCIKDACMNILMFDKYY